MQGIDVTVDLANFDHPQLLFNSMLNIRCYFTLFHDLARLYVEIHSRYLARGLELQGALSIEQQGPDAAKQLQTKQAELNAYTNESLPKIKKDITTVSNDCLFPLARICAHEMSKTAPATGY